MRFERKQTCSSSFFVTLCACFSYFLMIAITSSLDILQANRDKLTAAQREEINAKDNTNHITHILFNMNNELTYRTNIDT